MKHKCKDATTILYLCVDGSVLVIKLNHNFLSNQTQLKRFFFRTCDTVRLPILSPSARYATYKVGILVAPVDLMYAVASNAI